MRYAVLLALISLNCAVKTHGQIVGTCPAPTERQPQNLMCLRGVFVDPNVAVIPNVKVTLQKNHVHILLTPKTSLEKAVQFVKGGFSYRAKKELGLNMEVWQKGFSDHRIRDAKDYSHHVAYVRENPVRRHFCKKPEEHPYSSAHMGYELDPVPQGLEPTTSEERDTARLEGVPFQSKTSDAAAEGAPFQNKIPAERMERIFQERKNKTA